MDPVVIKVGYLVRAGGNLPAGTEGQIVGYGPGGVPVAVDPPSGGGYDDTDIQEQIAALTARIAALEGGQPVLTAPAAFTPNQWSVSTGLEAFQIVVSITELPSDGGSEITELQYDAGAGWVSLVGVDTGPRTLIMSGAGTAYDVQIRAVNAIDPGPASAAKSVTSGEEAVIPAIDSVVVIGASLMNSMFGKNLATPHATATSLLSAAGHDLPVYGYATGGARLDVADDHYAAARAAHPNALIVSHFGGNNVSDSRPYPGGQATFEAGLADLLALTQGDGHFYPMSMSFRDYDDTTFQTPENGSKPYNENILLPWITANFPHAMASYGRPIFDHYRKVLENFEAWLVADNVHLTSTGITQDREWIVSVIANVLDGVQPAEITERVYVAPEPEPELGTPGPLAVINFTSPTYSSDQAPYNNIDVDATTIGIADVRDVSGALSGVGFALSFTGDPIIAQTTPPGRGRNGNGRSTGLSNYADNLHNLQVVGANLYITSGVTAPMVLSGLVPGASYEIGFVGSRVATDVRTTRLTVEGIATDWNTSEDPPLERKVTVQAAGDGTIDMLLEPVGTTTFAYLGGLSVQRLAP